MRMGMAEEVDRDAAEKVQVSRAVGADEPRALAALEGERSPCISVIERRIRVCRGGHGDLVSRTVKIKRPPEGGRQRWISTTFRRFRSIAAPASAPV
jgi:hypothetical protein